MPHRMRFFTLVFGCNLPTIRAVYGLAPIRACSCWTNQKKRGSRPLCYIFSTFYVSNSRAIKITAALQHLSIPDSLAKNIRTSKCRIRPNFLQYSKDTEGRGLNCFQILSPRVSFIGIFTTFVPDTQSCVSATY